MACLLAPLRPTPLSLSVPRIRFGAKPPSNAAPAPIRLIRNSMSQPAAEANPDIPKSDTTDVLVQYVVLRRDLIDTWPTGSVVTQGCHASVSAIWSHKDDPITLQYCSPENIDSMHKVTLEVKGEPQIVNLSEKLKSGGIAHKLWIEQPENFPTCLATKPYPKSVVSAYFKKLKLCK
ncbi:putative peptidyl-tRNA hydrolase PTRHD1 [Pyrus x bretschneideri]|uniref:putative peptidyl-tRNA hydrolase PTRHD1 n=1 Tax=Pyrus x bretschneideri TaxID=225117 RepID=UPI000870A05D|nr:putative peptidyl-tRNA hydrolase PTRHD1 [Pyrus x bretschneideri]